MDYAHHATSIVGQSFECNDFVCHFMRAKFGGLSMYNSKAFYVLWAAASPPLRPTIPFQDILNELKCLQPAKQHLRCHFWEIYSRPRIAPVVRDLGMRALRSIDVTWLCAGPCNWNCVLPYIVYQPWLQETLETTLRNLWSLRWTTSGISETPKFSTCSSVTCTCSATGGAWMHWPSTSFYTKPLGTLMWAAG